MHRLVIGLQPVREAIRVHSSAVGQLLICQPPDPQSPLHALARYASDSGIPYRKVDRAELDRITKNAQHQGVIAYVPELAVHTIESLLNAPPSLLCILDRIVDPQNFGAIIRSSVAFGAEAIVWPEHDSAPLTPATFRASAGAIEHARLVRVSSLTATLQALGQVGINVVGLAGDSSTTLDTIDLTLPTAIVVGSEGTGLRRGVRKACSQIARLPTANHFATLNASVAAAVALYEVHRQRKASAENAAP